MPSDLYSLLKKYALRCLKVCCKKCEQRALTTDDEKSDSEIDELEITCIPNNGSSTPNLQRSYADVAADATKCPTKIDLPDMQEFKEKIQHLEKLILSISGATSSKCQEVNPTIIPSSLPDLPPNLNRIQPPSVPGVPPGLNRKRCLILMNVPESDADASQERVDHDVRHVRDCLQHLFTSGEEEIAKNTRPINVYRLGKRTTEKYRPLKIVFAAEREVEYILARTHRLKGLPVRVLRDLSPEDRARMKEAIQELREKRANGDTDWIIRDFRVVRRRPRIKWHPLQLQCQTLLQSKSKTHLTAEITATNSVQQLDASCTPTSEAL